MPRPTSFGRDPGLQIRIVVVLLLLGVVYAALVAALYAAGAGAVGIIIIAVIYAVPKGVLREFHSKVWLPFRSLRFGRA